jgi:hypothetical protein
LCCAGSVALPGRVACRSAAAGKTSHAQESSNNGITSRDCSIARRVACFFTKGQARSQKSGGWHSGESGCIAFTGYVARSWAQSKRHSQKSRDSAESFTVAWQILTWRLVQAEKFRGSQSRSGDGRHGKERERRGSN